MKHVGPQQVRRLVDRECPGLEGERREAVAYAALRTIRWRRGELRGPSGDRALDAVATDDRDWSELAQLALDVATRVEPDARGGGRIEGGAQRAQRTDAEMLHELRRLAARLGRTPTVDEMRRAPDCPSQVALMQRFGSFADACRLAGIEPRGKGSRPSWTDEELLEILRERAEEAGRVPGIEHMEAPCGATYALRFGGFRRAVRLAGLEELYTGQGRRPFDERRAS